MRHDILSRPKETAKLDIYSGSIYHAEDLGGAFVFVESNHDVGWKDPAMTLRCFGSVIRPVFSMTAALDSGPVYTLRIGSLSFLVYICTTVMSGMTCARVLSRAVLALGWNSVEP